MCPLCHLPSQRLHAVPLLSKALDIVWRWSSIFVRHLTHYEACGFSGMPWLHVCLFLFERIALSDLLVLINRFIKLKPRNMNQGYDKARILKSQGKSYSSFFMLPFRPILMFPFLCNSKVITATLPLTPLQWSDLFLPFCL